MHKYLNTNIHMKPAIFIAEKYKLNINKTLHQYKILRFHKYKEWYIS
jgi:hypothetical protein